MYLRRVKVEPTKRSFYLITNRITGGSFVLQEAEKERLNKELDKVLKELTKSENKLANENFVARAKPEVVEQERERKADWEQKRDQLQGMLANL